MCMCVFILLYRFELKDCFQIKRMFHEIYACLIDGFYLFHSFLVYLTAVSIAHVSVNGNVMVKGYWIGIDVARRVVSWYEVGLLTGYLPGGTHSIEIQMHSFTRLGFEAEALGIWNRNAAHSAMIFMIFLKLFMWELHSREETEFSQRLPAQFPCEKWGWHVYTVWTYS
jgi:hypothetical protein